MNYTSSYSDPDGVQEEEHNHLQAVPQPRGRSLGVLHRSVMLLLVLLHAGQATLIHKKPTDHMHVSSVLTQ